MKKVYLVILLYALFACKEHHHDEHSHAKVKLIIDGKAVSIDFSTHSGAIIGFEHTAKTQKEKAIKEEKFKIFKKNLAKMFQIEEGCIAEMQNLEIAKDGLHAVFHAQMQITCKGDLKDKELKFNIQQFYSEINELNIETISNGQAKTSEVSANGGKFKL